MTNYDMDEIERQRERERRSRGIKPENEWPKSIKLGKDETPHTAIDIELPDDDFKRIDMRGPYGLFIGKFCHNVSKVNDSLYNEINKLSSSFLLSIFNELTYLERMVSVSSASFIISSSISKSWSKFSTTEISATSIA